MDVFIFSSKFMDKQSQAVVGLIDESFKGNLRIRLHQLRTIDGSLTCLVEFAAWNAWAGQTKLLFAHGGIDRAAARELFAFLTEHLRGYDWHDDEILLEEK
jgi:hypothetical protein